MIYDNPLFSVDSVTPSQRIEICKDIYSSLQTAGLKESPSSAIATLKAILNDYARGNDGQQKAIQGVIPFPECQKAIVYYLPIRSQKKASVVLEHRLPEWFKTSVP